MAITINNKRPWSKPLRTRRLPAWRRRAVVKQQASMIWAVLPLFFLDAMLIGLSMAAAYQFRFRLLAYRASFSGAFYSRLAWIGIPMWLGIFALYSLYRPGRLFGGVREYTSVINACTTGLVGLILYSFLDRNIEHDISRGWLAMVWGLSIAGVCVARFGYRRLIYQLRKKGLFMQRALVVGANEEGQAVVSQLRASPQSGVKVVGFVDGSVARDTEIEGLKVLGDARRLGTLVQCLGVEELIIIPTAMSREELLHIYRDWGTDERVRLSMSSGLYELCTTGAQLREVGFVPLLSLNRDRITGLDALLKTALDYVGALVGTIMLAPLLLLIAILVRRDSEGPVIYRRRVVGLYGRSFDAFKFRTMIHNAEAFLEAHPELMKQWEQDGKIQDDPRITRVGRFLRRFSLDELPQLFNVLRGEMSLVGPRMITPAEMKHFGKWKHNRMTVKPGMTGLWQVSGRSDLSYEDRVRLDMQYIRNYTAWMDLRLIFSTIWTVLKGRGAY